MTITLCSLSLLLFYVVSLPQKLTLLHVSYLTRSPTSLRLRFYFDFDFAIQSHSIVCTLNLLFQSRKAEIHYSRLPVTLLRFFSLLPFQWCLYFVYYFYFECKAMAVNIDGSFQIRLWKYNWMRRMCAQFFFLISKIYFPCGSSFDFSISFFSLCRSISNTRKSINLFHFVVEISCSFL